MPRFLLDVMCGALAAPLRMCGHDTVYALDRDIEADDRLLELAAREDRTVITRDRELAERMDDTLLLTGTDPDDQLAELSEAGVSLVLNEEPTRCGNCNGQLSEVSEGAAVPDYVPSPEETNSWRCRDCEQYFWKGSHWDDVRERLQELREDPDQLARDVREAPDQLEGDGREDID